MNDDLEIRPAPEASSFDAIGPDRLPPAEESHDERRSGFRSYLDDPE